MTRILYGKPRTGSGPDSLKRIRFLYMTIYTGAVQVGPSSWTAPIYTLSHGNSPRESKTGSPDESRYVERNRSQAQLVPKALRMFPTNNLDVCPLWLAVADCRNSLGLSSQAHQVHQLAQHLASYCTAGNIHHETKSSPSNIPN
ncbi:hypothetical protein ElyMa_004303900 [Elysia marginata]|uniref:Uncharacterized protein n=1 Tax=Elysia marginata TaxID=1093978 RepID=A0AAV4GX07_9GAST|nr:hypothetical protein ElyMa_004303900 [Elysia marginata]